MWDHLDLVPLLQRLEAGDLSPALLLEIHHGSHSHSAAYLVLLATTRLSAGWPMADVFASWFFLVIFSGLMCLCVREVFKKSAPAQRATLLILTILMTLTTLHLPNLQWGWQVAVFICLCGVALGICAVSLDVPWMARLLMGGFGITLAVSSFATGVALLPAMILGLVLRNSMPLFSKLILIGLWSGLLVLLLYRLHYFAVVNNTGDIQVAGIAHYSVNYLGGGVVRFASILSVPVVACATMILLLTLIRLWRESRRATALWSMIAVFACGAALLTAYGRFNPFGANQAFVIRYGSFASLYWFAVFGAILSLRDLQSESRLVRRGYKVLVFMFIFNSLHFVPQAFDFYDDARTLEKSIAKHWPDVPEKVLLGLNPDQPETAMSQLQYLYDHAYPPFGEDGIRVNSDKFGED
jgi:hypothetical protein